MPEKTMEPQANPAAPAPAARRGQFIWNGAIVVALAANALLFVNNRQIAGSIAQMDQHNQDQISKLSQQLEQNSSATSQSVASIARQQESAQQAVSEAEARARQELRKTSTNLSA